MRDAVKRARRRAVKTCRRKGNRGDVRAMNCVINSRMCGVIEPVGSRNAIGIMWNIAKGVPSVRISRRIAQMPVKVCTSAELVSIVSGFTIWSVILAVAVINIRKPQHICRRPAF
jgi:hypothetical protein